MSTFWWGFACGVIAAVLPSLAVLAWYAWRAPMIADEPEHLPDGRPVVDD